MGPIRLYFSGFYISLFRHVTIRMTPYQCISNRYRVSHSRRLTSGQYSRNSKQYRNHCPCKHLEQIQAVKIQRRWVHLIDCSRHHQQKPMETTKVPGSEHGHEVSEDLKLLKIDTEEGENTVMLEAPPEVEDVQNHDAIESLWKIPTKLLSLAKAIFCWSIVAEYQITKSELFELLILRENPRSKPLTDKTALRDCESKFKDASGGLIQFDDNDKVHFINRRVRQQLVDGKHDFQISYCNASEYALLCILRYLSKGDITSDLQSSSESRKSIVEYYVFHLLDYYKQAEGNGKSVAIPMYQFIQGSNEAFLIWGDKYSDMTGYELGEALLQEPLAFAVRFGLEGLSELLLRMGRDPRVCVYGRTMAQLAERSGNKELAFKLLQIARLFHQRDLARKC